MVVCAQYKLAQVDKKFSKEHQTLIRNRAVVTRDYFDQRNKNWESNGLLYVEDEAATTKYYKDAGEQYKARKDAKALGSLAAKRLADAVAGVAGGTIAVEKGPAIGKTETTKEKVVPKEEKPKDVIVPEGNPTAEWDREPILKWLEGKENKDGTILEFKKTLGKARLFKEVVEPYLESLKGDAGSNEEEE